MAKVTKSDNNIGIIKELLKQPYFKYVGSEKSLEQYIVDNIDEISFYCGWGEVERIQRQFIIKNGNKRPRVDIMLWHKDGTGTIIECKISTQYGWMLSAIGQCLFYREISEFRLGKPPRMVLATDNVAEEAYGVISRYNLPIKILQIDMDKVIYV